MSQLDSLRALMQHRTPGQSLNDLFGLPPVPPQQAIPAPAYNPDAPKAEAPEWLRRTGNTLDTMSNAIGTGVQGAMAAPGNASRGVGTTMGQLLSGNPNAPDTARRTISSVLANPNDAITGQEVNQNAGIDSNPIASAITSAITDPLLMGTAAKLGAEAPAFMRSVLPRGSAPAAKAVAPRAGQTLSGQGVNTYITDASGNVSIRPPMPTPHPINNFGANGEQLFNNGSTQMSQAEQWAAQRAGMGVNPPPTSIAPPRLSASADVAYIPPSSSAATARNAVAGPQSLQDLRRQFTVVHDAGLDATNSPTFSRTIGGPAGDRAVNQSVNNLLQNEGVHGAFDPSRATATIREGALPGTARHESFHGLMDAARESGDSSSLGLLARGANGLQQSGSPLLQGLGYTGEEALAHGVQNGRNLSSQLGGAWRFLDNPTSTYSDLINRISPTAAAAYRARLVPNAVRGAGLAGAGAAAYGTGNAIMGE